MMHQMIGKTRFPRRGRAGFTLVEVLIALGLFAIGMIAMASLFPVAALLQRQTASEIIGDHAATSAQSIVNAKQLTYKEGSGDLGTYHSKAGPNKSQPVAMHKVKNTLLTERFPFSDRSYPTGLPAIDDRDLFWVPFLQDISGDPTNPNFVMRIFLLEAHNQAGYPIGRIQSEVSGIIEVANPDDPDFFPKVVSVSCNVSRDNDKEIAMGSTVGLEGGDVIMDSNGVDYIVASVSGSAVTLITPVLKSPSVPNRVWYAPSLDGSASPTQRVKTVKIDTVPPRATTP